MNKIIILLVGILTLTFLSCNNDHKKESRSTDNQTTTLEEALAKIDSLKKYDTLSDSKEHIIISPDSSIFDKNEANEAYKALIKKLTQKKIISIKKDNEQAIVIDSYDATDSCYKFRLESLSKDTTLGTYILGWWDYFPKTKKVVNGITFEELN
jgi:hypothetical protein